MRNLGKLTSIKEVENLKLETRAALTGKGGRLGFSQLVNNLQGWGGKDGFEIKTDTHTWLILIDNGQSCCEDWGYIVSNDHFKKFLGKEVISVKLTDKALNTKMVEKEKEIYEGGIQFVDFNFSDGDSLQFAVYNSHNGYYGHDIVVARDKKVILDEVL